MLLQKLAKQNLIQPPSWLVDNCMYLTVMGSDAYGVSSASSDVDIYGFCMPLKEVLFPHLSNEIIGFGRQTEQFHVWQQHHIPGDNKASYDMAIYSIVRYFDLCMACNPNMIDSLFTPRRCVIHSTAVSELVREQRKLFLHKGAWATYRGYAFSQISKLKNKVGAKNPARDADIKNIGYDSKFFYHIVRLILQVEQILVEYDLDLERNREQLKAIRRGEWDLPHLYEYFAQKELSLETIYANSKLPEQPDTARIKTLLINCLEMHYGSLQAVITQKPVDLQALLTDLSLVLAKHGQKI